MTHSDRALHLRHTLGQQLQGEGAQAFVDSWHDLIERITSMRGELSAAAS